MAIKNPVTTKHYHQARTRKRDTMRTLSELCQRSDAEWAQSDIAITNLKCAIGLPHRESLDIGRCLDKLGRMARQVRRETERNLYRFHRVPSEWDDSEAYWTACMMITVLQQDFGVRYNPQRIHDPDFRDSRDLFIHGMLFGSGGTCASMPVLYVAVGRRLGYPLKLVHAKGHVFARWDDPDGMHWHHPARFNMEASNQGLKVYADEYYHTWPLRMEEWEMAEGGYLRSLSPREEFASFLAMRGHCLQDTKRFSEAAQVYAWAAELAPRNPLYAEFRNTAMALSGVPVPPGLERYGRAAERELARITALDN